MYVIRDASGTYFGRSTLTSPSRFEHKLAQAYTYDRLSAAVAIAESFEGAVVEELLADYRSTREVSS